MNFNTKLYNFTPIALTLTFLMFFNFFGKKSTTEIVLLPDLSLVTPLYNAFSHNDYKHEKPLLDALSHGFTYIEADVHLINKKLYVSHNRPFFLDEKNKLTELYLNPLFEIFKFNEGRIFPQSEKPIHLVIDIKTGAKRTYLTLQKILEPYQRMLTRWENNQIIPGAVTISISGNRPIKELIDKPNRWMCLDGRLEDIGKNYSPEVMPMISDKYSKVFGWTIFSKPPSNEKLLKLHDVANNVHAEGKKLRLWKSPENTLVWDAMLEAGIDIINTDSIAMLSNYFSQKESTIPMANKNK